MIIAFILFALVVSVSVTLLLLRAFVKLSSKYKTTGQENPENMLIKQHKNELREDYSLGLIESKQYSFAQNELEGNFSEKLSAVKAIHDEKSIAPFFALIASLLFCGIAGLIYFYVGNYEAINDNPIGREESFDISEEKFLEMTEQLAEQLKNNPSDVKGWTMLAKSYRLLGRLNDSAEALKKAAKLDPVQSLKYE